MKKIQLIIFCLVSLLFSSCNDFLTLYPEDDIVDDKYWTDGDKVQSVVAASYRYMADNNVVRKMLYWGELRSDNVSYSSGGDDVKNFIDANILSSNSLVGWSGFYKVINICNNVLTKAPAVVEKDSNFTEEKLHNYMAEAYTVRALCYFYLVRAFGDVPYVTSPSDSDQKNYLVSQSKGDSIVTALISDLTDYAVKWAPEDWPTEAASHGRITVNAVRALLADLYLWKASDKSNASAADDYQSCVDYCDAILNDASATYTFSPQQTMYTDVFYQGNAPENIFEINFTDGQLANSSTADVYGNPNKGKTAQVSNSQNLLNSFGDNDTRRFQYFKLNYTGTAPNVEIASSSIFKYEGMRVPSEYGESSYSYRSNTSYANWIIYRLSDVYLMKAEALAELAKLQGDDNKAAAAVHLCNVVYKRANNDLDSLTYGQISDAEKVVLEERRREFCFEGKRWFDLLRKVRREGSVDDALNLLVSARSGETSLYKARLSSVDAWYLPIPKSELDANPHLHQNAYYAMKEE
ncbi:MAG: RagB/SusD family nutrient uptake outer membrane protein [Prevotella sp.]